jgi:cytoplasmic iron level regulating protein YaaA (DUF328/UPF0246 family)
LDETCEKREREREGGASLGKFYGETAREELTTMINNIFMDVKSAYWMKLVKREREREREELH